MNVGQRKDALKKYPILQRDLILQETGLADLDRTGLDEGVSHFANMAVSLDPTLEPITRATIIIPKSSPSVIIVSTKRDMVSLKY